MHAEHRLPIVTDADILVARQAARSLAAVVQFTGSEATVIATAVSEVARNILLYARTGEIAVSIAHKGERRGIAIVARDRGPGIADIAGAMQDGFSTSGGLGLGLPGCRRLMDEFAIESRSGAGTIVRMTKWRF